MIDNRYHKNTKNATTKKNNSVIRLRTDEEDITPVRADTPGDLSLQSSKVKNPDKNKSRFN